MTFIVDANLKLFIPVAKDSDFPLQNLPFGIFKPTIEAAPRARVALGEFVLDLSALEQADLIKVKKEAGLVFAEVSLNHFFSLGIETCRDVRKQLVALLRADTKLDASAKTIIEKALYKQAEVIMCVPMDIRDYTDFYASEQHAFNVGSMFRGKSNELMPNWKHMPIAYHGRASSIVTTGAPIYCPHGQVLNPETEQPEFSASKRLDFELEMGFFIGKGNQQGKPVMVKDAEGYVIGMVLVNDWSSRDIQKWEYQPLGPFLAKSFSTSISPWIVTIDALTPFKTELPSQQPQPLPYLQTDTTLYNYDINLEVSIQTEKMQTPEIICRSNHQYLYWSIAQQIAHHTIGGCNLNVGDLMASGTISGPTAEQFGSLLELTWAGKNPLTLNSGEKRVFIEDGDQIIMQGFCEGAGYRIGFGTLRNQVLANPNF